MRRCQWSTTCLISVVTLALGSILCFFCGFLNGVICLRVSNRSRPALAPTTSVNIPIYDVIALTPTTELEIKDNVAYCNTATVTPTTGLEIKENVAYGKTVTASMQQ